jgi:hypothetical protein
MFCPCSVYQEISGLFYEIGKDIHKEIKREMQDCKI